MAKAPAKAPAPKASGKVAKGKSAKGGGGKSKSGLFLPLMLICIGSVFVLPATLVVLGGMIPTFVTLITDKSRGKSMSVAVGSLNLTGVTYVVIQVALKGMRLDYAAMLLQDPINWLIMWGGAGIGLALLSLVPPIVAQILTTISEVKLQKLKANQVEIRKIWGEDVKEA